MSKTASVADRVGQLAADCASVLSLRLVRHHDARSVDGRRVTFVQFGDYEEAFRRFERGGSENYYAQKYSVEFVGSLARRPDIESVTVICAASRAAAAVLPNGVRTVGIELYPKDASPRYGELVNLLRECDPTHLVAMTPCIPLISWGVRNGCQVLPLLADSFRAKGLKAALDYRLLALLFNSSALPFIANHNLAASLDLYRIGVSADKVVPFDWPALISPRDYAAKSAPPSSMPFRLLYVGAVIESKGVGDAIAAVRLLRRGRADVTLTIIGRGALDTYRQMARDQGLEDFVSLAGAQSHSAVVTAMRSHDAVVVPSHWAYPEGLPMTLYEALCTRTPLLTSDHPMFALRIRDGYNALVFPERDPAALAKGVSALLASPDLYRRLSVNALEAADAYLCPLKYDELISRFLGLSNSQELARYSLRRYYPDGLPARR